MSDYPKGSLVATIRLVPTSDADRDALGLCRGSGKPPIPGSLVGGVGECGGCGERLELESGLVRQHPV